MVCMVKKAHKTFRELEQELAHVLKRVENAEYEELDELMADYNTGKEIIDLLEKKLEQAKNSINTITKE